VEILVAVLIVWILPIFIAHAIGKPKRRAGWAWGLFLGWLGVIIVFLLPSRPDLTLEELERRKATLSPKWYEEKKAELLAGRVYRECPHCKEQMRRDASVCPHCQRDSPAWTLHEGHWWSQVDETWYRLDELTNNWVRAEAE
jgi:hypothetical protein